MEPTRHGCFHQGTTRSSAAPRWRFIRRRLSPAVVWHPRQMKEAPLPAVWAGDSRKPGPAAAADANSHDACDVTRAAPGHLGDVGVPQALPCRAPRQRRPTHPLLPSAHPAYQSDHVSFVSRWLRAAGSPPPPTPCATPRPATCCGPGLISATCRPCSGAPRSRAPRATCRCWSVIFVAQPSSSSSPTGRCTRTANTARPGTCAISWRHSWRVRTAKTRLAPSRASSRTSSLGSCGKPSAYRTRARRPVRGRPAQRCPSPVRDDLRCSN
jgi:hypothetical protein